MDNNNEDMKKMLDLMINMNESISKIEENLYDISQSLQIIARTMEGEEENPLYKYL